MKKILPIAAVAAAILAVSCNKQEKTSSFIEPADGVRVDVLVNTRADAATRADGASVEDTQAERTIKRLDLFVFNHASGALDAYAEGTATTTDGTYAVRDVKVSNTVLDFYAVANAPASLKDGIATVANLQAAVSAFADNASDAFVMVGSKAEVDVEAIDADATSAKKQIRGLELERIVNKVQINKVTKAFSSPAFQNAEVKLLGLFVVNANKSTGYLADAVPAEGNYFNATEAFETNALISADFANAPKTVTAEGVALGNAFYFYPNAASESASVSRQDKVTKLALKVSVAGSVYWYPIEILQAPEAHNRNLVYVIENVTLRRPGNPEDPTDPTDPNKYIDETSVDVQMTVKDWVSADIAGSYNGWMN